MFSILDNHVENETESRMANTILEGRGQNNTDAENENEESKK